MYYTCEYCSAVFKTNAGYKRHMCSKKALAGSTGQVALRRSYMLFNFWYTYSGFNRKPKTFSEFLKSPYFKKFVELDDYLTSFYSSNNREYLKWCVDNGIPSKNWCKDITSDKYLKEVIRKDDPIDSVIKSLEQISRWCERRNISIDKFFSTINPGESIEWIISSRIDPWVLLLCDNSDKLLSRLSKEQLDIVNETLDLEYWSARISISKITVDNITSILDEIGMNTGEIE